MKFIKVFVFAFSMLPLLALSQGVKKDTVPERPQRPAFQSSFIIDNPTNVLYPKKSLEFQIKHRFGLVNTGQNDRGGLWGNSNIRLGLTYSVHNNWTLGWGTTKFDRLEDFNLKAAILRQTRSDKIPINISYYGNMAIDTRDKENFERGTDRLSFFNQIIISRRFSPKLSLQVATSLSHYNYVEYRMNNDVFGLAVGGRYKFSKQGSILVDYSHPFTHHLDGEVLDEDPEPGLSVGVEFATLGHAFQIIVSNLNGIVPQKNYVFNQNNFFEGDVLIGFNITRIFRFK